MIPIDDDAVTDLLTGYELAFVGSGAPELALLPEPWRPIAFGPDEATRTRTALTLWNPELIALLPRFWGMLTGRLVDVRAAVAGGYPVLVYVARTNGDEPIAWVGIDPRTLGIPPPLWAAVPAPLRAFLTDVHAGFTAPDGESYGAIAPSSMTTLAEYADFPDGIPGWDDDGIPSTRLLRLTTDGGIDVCASPDLPAGQIAIVYEGDVDAQDFGPAFDAFVTGRFEDR